MNSRSSVASVLLILFLGSFANALTCGEVCTAENYAHNVCVVEQLTCDDLGGSIFQGGNDYCYNLGDISCCCYAPVSGTCSYICNANGYSTSRCLSDPAECTTLEGTLFSSGNADCVSQGVTDCCCYSTTTTTTTSTTTTTILEETTTTTVPEETTTTTTTSTTTTTLPEEPPITTTTLPPETTTTTTIIPPQLPCGEVCITEGYNTARCLSDVNECGELNGLIYAQGEDDCVSQGVTDCCCYTYIPSEPPETTTTTTLPPTPGTMPSFVGLGSWNDLVYNDSINDNFVTSDYVRYTSSWSSPDTPYVAYMKVRSSATAHDPVAVVRDEYFVSQNPLDFVVDSATPAVFRKEQSDLGVVVGDNITYANQYSRSDDYIDLTYQYGINSIKERLVIRNGAPIMERCNATQTLIYPTKVRAYHVSNFTEGSGMHVNFKGVEIPENYNMSSMDSSLELLDSQNQTIWSMDRPYIYDSSSVADAYGIPRNRVLALNYSVEMLRLGDLKVNIEVPCSFFVDAVYPVSIDPTWETGMFCTGTPQTCSDIGYLEPCESNGCTWDGVPVCSGVGCSSYDEATCWENRFDGCYWNAGTCSGTAAPCAGREPDNCASWENTYCYAGTS